MIPHTSTRQTLLQRLSAGQDPAAWEEFCKRYGALIRGFAQRQGLQGADCDEILQEVLLGLTRSMPGFRYDPAKGKFRAYLKTAVLHAIYRKSRQKKGELELRELEAAVQAGTAPKVEGHWEAEWRQYHLRQAMRTIEVEFSEKDRAAFESYAVAGSDATEVARLLGLTADQVYQAKSRILKRLGELVALQVQDEG